MPTRQIDGVAGTGVVGADVVEAREALVIHGLVVRGANVIVSGRLLVSG